MYKKIIICILIVLVIVLFVIVSFFKFKTKEIGISDYQNLKYFSEVDNYIIEKIDIGLYVDGDVLKVPVPQDKILVILNNKNELLDLTGEPGMSVFDYSKGSNAYFIDKKETFVNLNNNIKINDQEYTYNIKLTYVVNDPVTLLNNINLENNIKQTELFKITSDAFLKDNLNKYILKFINENNLSHYNLISSEINNYLLYNFTSELQLVYYGVDIISVDLLSIS